jgi:hypothetical protein
MGLAHSPRIVTDGLVLCLDAANPKSYPGTGTTWFDISANNFNAILNGSVTFSGNNLGGVLTPPSQITSWIRMPEQALQSLSNGSVWTLEWGMTVLSHSGTRFAQSMASPVTDNGFLWQINSTTMLPFTSSLLSGSNVTWALNEPIVVTVARTGDLFAVYKNGVKSAEYSRSTILQTTITGVDSGSRTRFRSRRI